MSVSDFFLSTPFLALENSIEHTVDMRATLALLSLEGLNLVDFASSDSFLSARYFFAQAQPLFCLKIALTQRLYALWSFKALL